MPIYEYRCPGCNLKFELLRPMNRADEAVSCPSCHNGARRILSSFASFSKSADGITTLVGSSCGGCSATSCGPCSAS